MHKLYSLGFKIHIRIPLGKSFSAQRVSGGPLWCPLALVLLILLVLLFVREQRFPGITAVCPIPSQVRVFRMANTIFNYNNLHITPNGLLHEQVGSAGFVAMGWGRGSNGSYMRPWPKATASTSECTIFAIFSTINSSCSGCLIGSSVFHHPFLSPFLSCISSFYGPPPWPLELRFDPVNNGGGARLKLFGMYGCV